jgi:sugar-specific transcriptional regulator TrmB
MLGPKIPEQYKRASEALAELGFSENESKVYLLLLLHGGMKAGEIAKDLGIHRLDVYDILKRMQTKQIVESTISKPMIFNAIPLSETIDHIGAEVREDIDRHIAALATLRSESKNLEALRGNGDSAKGAPADRLQILSGRKSINERWQKLISLAEHEILIAVGDSGAAEVLFSNGIDTLAAKLKSGIQVRVFTPITRLKSADISGIKDTIRHMPSSNSAGLCIVDKRRVMILVETEDRIGQTSTNEDTAIVTESRSIVELLWILFFVGWDTSPGIQEQTT